MGNEQWEMVALAGGYADIKAIPTGLVDTIERLDERIKDANGMSFGNREDYSLRSSQAISLAVMLWQQGSLK